MPDVLRQVGDKATRVRGGEAEENPAILLQVSTGRRRRRIPRHKVSAADHGRIETRRYWLTDDIERLGVKGSWANGEGVSGFASGGDL